MTADSAWATRSITRAQQVFEKAFVAGKAGNDCSKVLKFWLISYLSAATKFGAENNRLLLATKYNIDKNFLSL